MRTCWHNVVCGNVVSQSNQHLPLNGFGHGLAPGQGLDVRAPQYFHSIRIIRRGHKEMVNHRKGFRHVNLGRSTKRPRICQFTFEGGDCRHLRAAQIELRALGSASPFVIPIKRPEAYTIGRRRLPDTNAWTAGTLKDACPGLYDVAQNPAFDQRGQDLPGAWRYDKACFWMERSSF